MVNQAKETEFITQEINNTSGNIENTEVSLSVSELSKQTSNNILDAIYKDEGVIKSIFSILGSNKIDPAKMVEDLSLGREEFKKQVANDMSYKTQIEEAS